MARHLRDLSAGDGGHLAKSKLLLAGTNKPRVDIISLTPGNLRMQNLGLSIICFLGPLSFVRLALALQRFLTHRDIRYRDLAQTLVFDHILYQNIDRVYDIADIHLRRFQTLKEHLQIRKFENMTLGDCAALGLDLFQIMNFLDVLLVLDA